MRIALVYIGMRKTLDCEICGKRVPRVTANQKVCADSECKRLLRRRRWHKNYHAARKDPICVWCGKPIKEEGKRKYHSECRREKERRRVKLYYLTHGEVEKSSKKRDFKATLICKYCKKVVPRTGARQFTCCSHECTLARRREEKARARARKRVSVKKIECPFCGKVVIKRSRLHVTCGSDACKYARSKQKLEERRAEAPLLCEICELPIKIRRGRVRYHAKCKAERDEENGKRYRNGVKQRINGELQRKQEKARRRKG